MKGMSRTLGKWFPRNDIFIIYSHKDALAYAPGLANRLGEKGLACFLDQLESVPDNQLPKGLVRELISCKMAVVLGTPGAVQSAAMDLELAWFRRMGKGPIIPIDFGTMEASLWYPRIPGLARTPELPDLLLSGEPSEEVIQRIFNSFRYATARKKLRRMVFGAAALLLALLGGIGWTSKRLVDGQAMLAQQEMIADSLKKEYAKVSQEILEQKNRAAAADQQRIFAEASRDTAQAKAMSSRKISDSLGRVNIRLALDDQKSNLRNLAFDVIDTDPVKSFWYARHVYQLDTEDGKSQSLLLSALSRIELYYTRRFQGYSLEYANPPWLLLVSKESGSRRRIMVNLKTYATSKVGYGGESACVVPFQETWRILTCDALNDSTIRYELQDGKGKIIGEPVIGDIPYLNHRVLFQDASKAHIVSFSGGWRLKWDLVDDVRKRFRVASETPKAMGVNRDGFMAEQTLGRLFLSDSSGFLRNETETQINSDYLYSRGRWSEDGSYLAYFDSQRKSLGIWDPVRRSLTPLDPAGWTAESFAWSPRGHQLVFSGRNENNLNVTIELINAKAIDRSRKVLHKGASPFADLVFSPDEKSIAGIDKEGQIAILNLQEGTLLASGIHKGANRILWTEHSLVTSGDGDVRFWGLEKAPTHHWIFESDTVRKYLPKAAVDSGWNWLAVGFRERYGLCGIELRSIGQSGVQKDLVLGRGSYGLLHDLQFSTDGKWLGAAYSNLITVWNLATGESHQFGLDNGIAQFIGLDWDAGKLKVEALGAGWTTAKSKSWLVIDLASGTPRRAGKLSGEPEKHPTGWKKSPQLPEGWVTRLNISKYRSMGAKNAGAGMMVRILCRDEALGATDCDLEFIPSDMKRLISLFGNLFPQFE